MSLNQFKLDDETTHGFYYFTTPSPLGPVTNALTITGRDIKNKDHLKNYIVNLNEVMNVLKITSNIQLALLNRKKKDSIEFITDNDIYFFISKVDGSSYDSLDLTGIIIVKSPNSFSKKNIKDFKLEKSTFNVNIKDGTSFYKGSRFDFDDDEFKTAGIKANVSGKTVVDDGKPNLDDKCAGNAKLILNSIYDGNPRDCEERCKWVKEGNMKVVENTEYNLNCLKEGGNKIRKKRSKKTKRKKQTKKRKTRRRKYIRRH